MRHLLFVTLLSLSLLSGLATGAETKGVDIRVLIDISGSMRQNDPDNLRRPALRMLVGLMQPGTQAGVWTFARWVNMLVPHGDVDKAWKKRAIALSKKIGSPGQFTNIEDVLDQASRSWHADPGATNRHLVLLTDGMVDISKDPAENQASRDRIIKLLLPRLKKAGARIHAIALSDRADHDLMRALTIATDGWYQQVASADELQRVFLKIFDKVGQPDGVPLEGNRFQVDRSIKEATVLVFRTPDSPKTRLHAPDGQSFEGSHLPGGIAWHADQGYDLITITGPVPGEWRLEADVDPDNRVMVVTDLSLETSLLPNRLAVAEQVVFSAYLANKGQVIDRSAFLELVETSASSEALNGTESHPINDEGRDGDETAGDGRFGMQFGSASPRGEVALRVRAESATFVREKRFVVDIAAPATLEIAGQVDAASIRLTVDTTVVQRINSATLYQEDPQGNRIALTAEATGKNQWLAALQNPAWPAKADLEARTQAGGLIQTTLGPLYVDGVAPVPEPVPAPDVAADAEIAVPRPEEAVAPNNTVTEDAGWVMPAAIFGGVNLFLMIGGGLAWWLVRRRGAADTDEIQLLSDDAPEALSGAAAVAREEAA